LGSAGVDDAQRLLPFIADDDDEVALHALAGIGEINDSLLTQLRKMLLKGSDREAASAVALLVDEGEPGLRILFEVAQRDDRAGLWGRAALGRLPEAEVREVAGDLSPVLDAALSPMWTDQWSWLRNQQPHSPLDLLRQQCVRHMGKTHRKSSPS
jgi:hypothetical protein